jgi:hypothetical protein
VLVLLVTAIALLASPATEAQPSPFPPRWATHMDRTLGRAVDAMSGKRDTVVWCWSVADWELRRDPWRGRERVVGEGLWGAYTLGAAVQLAPNLCAALKLMRTSRMPVWEWNNPEGLAWATYALAHESVHVAGYGSERKATCWGLQRVERMARKLGRTAKEGRYLAKLAWKRWLSDQPPVLQVVRMS